MTSKTLPIQFESQYKVIEDQVTWLFILLQQIKCLFLDRNHLELLKKRASTFFYIVQKSIGTELVLGIARLEDPQKVGNNKNISFKGLVESVKELGDVKLGKEISDILDNQKPLITKFKKHRDKIIAHLDYPTIINDKISFLPNIIYNDFEKILGSYEKILKVIKIHYTDDFIPLNPFVQNGADEVIYLMQDALHYQELKLEGKIPFKLYK